MALQEQVILPGYYVQVGWGQFSRCKDCGKLVRINKPILDWLGWGAVHWCLSEQDHALIQYLRARQAAQEVKVDAQERLYDKHRGKVTN